jgi:hypothetical protein
MKEINSAGQQKSRGKTSLNRKPLLMEDAGKPEGVVKLIVTADENKCADKPGQQADHCAKGCADKEDTLMKFRVDSEANQNPHTDNGCQQDSAYICDDP